MGIIRDHDFLEDLQGWMFCVVGDIHPPDGFFAYPKYALGPGPWRRGERSFTRTLEKYSMSELKNLLENLKRLRPECVRLDYVLGAEMFFLPSIKILKHYSCNEDLKKIIEKDDRDVLEQLLVDLVHEFSDLSGVRLEYFGVTGSILLGIHHERSDIDLVIYGKENYWKVIEALDEITSPRYEHSLKRFSTIYPIKVEDAKKLARRVRHKRTYRGANFSIYGVRKQDEIDEKYGDYIYRMIGLAKAELEVVDSSRSCFTPSIYIVEGYAEIGGVRYPVERLTCYDLTYTALLHEGDKLEVFGKLEEVINARSNNSFHHVLIGSFEAAEREYIKLLI
ncbi:MAG: nucleotidyltransferase domain-containing protein [Nitrososphaerota archaeon]